jgi:hypothetical protein
MAPQVHQLMADRCADADIDRHVPNDSEHGQRRHGPELAFEPRPVQVIKSISQRSLVGYWASLRARHPLPAFNDFAPPARLHDPKQLMFWQVECDGPQRSFRSLHQGSNVGEVLGGGWSAGLRLEQIVPEPLVAFSLAGSHRCAESGLPIYMVISTTDPDGHAIDCERLLLPFGNGAAVQQQVGSLQLISTSGAFDRRTVLDRFRQHASVTLACQISIG